MRILRGLSCLVLAAAVWLASLHLWFSRAPEAVAGPLAARQLALWQRDSPELAASLAVLRHANPEWDLMARMFAVLAFANLALREPDRRVAYLAAIDAILERTLADEARAGAHLFLLPYGRARPFRDPAGRSLFVDGEIALMISARDLVEPGGPHDARPWIDRVIRQLARGPVLLGESYPDEAWLFCNTAALAAVRLHDVTAGAPERHAGLFRHWVASARAHVIDPRTGLLVAETTLDGVAQDGPEGSTLWLAATMLLVVDEAFAREQYGRARDELRGSLAGFGWAREWPRSWPGPDDIDSGPTVPIVGANAGSSGLALVAAMAFGDDMFAGELIASLGLAGFPVDGGARFAAGNQLADAVILFALTSGPLWERAGVRGGAR
jgi:hypothetical protein